MGHYKPHTQETKDLISKKRLLPPSNDHRVNARRERNRLRMRSWVQANPDRVKQRGLAWRNANKQKVRDYNLRSRIGISLSQWDYFFVKQEGKCGICQAVPQKRLVADHCHSTGKFRGLLCIRCNGALGIVERYLNDKIWSEGVDKWLL